MSWQTQQYTKPLFEDLIWSKPQQKSLAGKLLIIGGNSHAIAAPSEAFALASQQGAGTVKAAMPSATRKLLGAKVPVEIELVSSTPSGSFSTNATRELENFCLWSDMILFAGDIGRNSETAIVLEHLTSKLSTPMVVTRDAADYFTNSPLNVLERKDTLLVLSLAQLQKYAAHAKYSKAITFDMGLVPLITACKELTAKHNAYIVTQHFDSIITAVDGQIVVTKIPNEPKNWRLRTATSASVWWMQNYSRPLQSIATSIVQLNW
jgi:ADP-dependent NAD(P)H-hydrate dehydratase / NAD(P)H-hydrate epimerase